ncbi:MAG: Na+/H+ antiporter NhaA [Planctomycetota bacterium]|nr:Na+/H+ antiporter NhaA [Planctomycetota bacterium]
MSSQRSRVIRYLQDFSIPLIAGVVAALFMANVAPETYHYWFGSGHGAEDGIWELPGHFTAFGHHLTLSFLINDIFMVFFFAIAAKEITEAGLPGGSLNPLRKAINPLFATVGGVVGPVAVFFICIQLAAGMGIYDKTSELWPAVSRGWGIPTATDIALAWLVARAVFGGSHPAVNFLLLLAVADDALGLGIIAIFYGDPAHPAEPGWLALVGMGVAFAYLMRARNVKSWVPYIFVAGPFAWCGLMLAHMHPALALVPIVPFMPGPKRDTGLFAGEDEVDIMGEETARDLHIGHSTLDRFEHSISLPVDFGLFFFAIANAGVRFEAVGPMTWIILASLVIGKTGGVVGMSVLGKLMGFSLPRGMGYRDLVMAGFIAGLGLTVALFVATAAFPASMGTLQGEAKMGALMSAGVGLVAVLVGRIFGMHKDRSVPEAESDETRQAA